MRAFERALLARGVPFAYAGGESLEVSTDGAQWIVCTTAGGLKPDVLVGAARARQEARHAKVTIGPRVPDARRLDAPARRRPHDVRGLEVEPLDDLARADALVARRIDELGAADVPVDPPDAYVTVHEDDAGTPRVVFVMNPTNESIVAKVGVAGPATLTSLIGDSVVYARTSGGFELTIPARTVRIFSASDH